MAPSESHASEDRERSIRAAVSRRGEPPRASADGMAPPDRRRFLAGLAAAAAAPAVLGCAKGQAEAQGGAASQAAAGPQAQVQPVSVSKAAAVPLPSIQLGKYQVSRLIAGANPINGFSYLGPHVDQHMKQYFTPERTVEFLLHCQNEGINTHQFSFSSKRKLDYLPMARDRIVGMHFIGLLSAKADIGPAIEAVRPAGLVHHGGVTDRLFGQGKSQEVQDFVKAAHDAGVMAGVSSHCPDNIKRIADEGWDVDFFMTCFYFLTRESTPGAEEKAAPVPTLEVSHAFYKDDPVRMTEVIRQVEKPCLGFKILAAGRKCLNEKMVREAFQFAFQRIKPTDAVIVGMYPWYFDEVKANAEYTRELGGG